MARFTVFGATGFIGRNLTVYLKERGHEVLALGRSDKPAAGSSLGHAVYCIGMTANFRSNLTGTVRAHVGVLADIIDAYAFESFLYLSSTRVYAGSLNTGEDNPLVAQPNSADHVYNLSKMTGEALCLAKDAPGFRVARLSNVIGPGDAAVNFLPSLVDTARREGRLVIRTSPESSKDYVDIRDVCGAIETIGMAGKHRLYNVASGVNATNRVIAEAIARSLKADVAFARDAPTVSFPAIDISRARDDLSFSPGSFDAAFARLIGSGESNNKKGER